MADKRPAPVVRLVVTNRSTKPTDLVLEPVGEIYPIEPGQSLAVRLTGGDTAPELAIDIHDGLLKIWEESAGMLELED